jgi:hypothetical protein
MTTDQERTIDALSLFHGGWAVAEDVTEEGWPMRGRVFRVKTAGDQPNFIVFDNGDADVHLPWDYAGRMTAEQVQLAVYGQEV